MPRTPVPRRIRGSDRGTDYDPVPSPLVSNHPGVLFLDEFLPPPSNLYPVSRVGTGLLPAFLPSDVRRLVADYTNRRSIHTGLVPEDRDPFREPGQRPRFTDLGDPQHTQYVACPICNRWYPARNMMRWIHVFPPHIPYPGTNAQTEDRRQWTMALGNARYPSNALGILVCSDECAREYRYHTQAQNARRMLATGSPADLFLVNTRWPVIQPEDYYGVPRLLAAPTDDAPVRSRWKRPLSTQDSGN